jgi:hypothetical protein
MKRVILICETRGWAFENICKQIVKAYGDRYDCQIVDIAEITRWNGEPQQCDVAMHFWWKSALRYQNLIRSKRIAVGIYDHWSIPQQPQQFQECVDLADCFFVANEAIAADLALRAPGKPIYLTEDGVDLVLFTPQPFPAEFTVGWAGNGVYETLGMGDLKGIKLITEAARRCNVNLVIQDKQTKQLAQVEMPKEFYSKISCYVCASTSEGTPNPVLEALACGRAVVSTRVGVVPKLERECDRSIELVDRTVEAIVAGIQSFRPGRMSVETRSDYIKRWAWSEKIKAFGPVLEGK